MTTIIADTPGEVLPASPPIARSLGFNFSWTLVGNVTYGGCQWLLLVLIARLGDPQMVGTFALAQAIAAPIVLFSNLQLRFLQATDSNARYRFGHYLALRYLTTLAAALVIFIWALAAGYSRELLEVILIVTLAKSVESLSDVYFGLLQQHEEMSRIAKSMIIKGVSSLIALGATLYITRRLTFAALALMLTWILIFGVYDSRAPRFCGLRTVRPLWDAPALMTLTRLAFPLGLAMMLNVLSTSLPRYFMEHYQGTRRLGLFSVLGTIQAAGMLIVVALGNAVLPRLARSYHDADWHRFRNTFLLFMAFSMSMGAAVLVPVIIAGDRLIALVFGPAYAGQNQTFTWLAFAAAISYCTAVLGYAAAASRRISFQPAAYALVAAATALGCYRLVPAYGGLGAAISMSAASLLGTLLYLISFAGTARELRGRSAGLGENRFVSQTP
jgi:O-antigen/teichoic acid export membrane protein